MTTPAAGDGLKAVSLFSGAGGLDLGIEAAGYSVIAAIENDPVAVSTLNRNRARYFPALGEVELRDITKLDPESILNHLSLAPGEIDLLVGGPPCVAFSKSGFHLDYKREGRDPRAGLLWDYLRFLEVLSPKAYLLENVYGLAYRNQSAPFFNGLQTGIRGMGYSFHYKVLNAADYGVPQNRQRLFVIGAREGFPLAFPPPTHWGEHERRKPPPHVDGLLRHVSARTAFRGLVSRPEPEEAVNGKYGQLLREIPPGKNYLHFTAHEGHPNPMFEWRSRYWTFLLKLHPNKPASTIQAQPGPYVGPFHWRNRRLRVAELKRLHVFPDDYAFDGTRRQIQVQVGNAVPPPLGRMLGIAIRKQVVDQEPLDSAQHELPIP
ncbi:MAG: DNA cytosine methyltransferase [Actinomycetota bacterium]